MEGGKKREGKGGESKQKKGKGKENKRKGEEGKGKEEIDTFSRMAQSAVLLCSTTTITTNL